VRQARSVLLQPIQGFENAPDGDASQNNGQTRGTTATCKESAQLFAAIRRLQLGAKSVRSPKRFGDSVRPGVREYDHCRKLGM
jgi:hypothetical protein